MAELIEYYAITRNSSSTADATGIIRRRTTEEGRVDESLRRNFSWQPSSALYEWEMGDVSGRHLIKISEAEAERLIERFREKWTEQG
jgi:hypothetical protein